MQKKIDYKKQYKTRWGNHIYDLVRIENCLTSKENIIELHHAITKLKALVNVASIQYEIEENDPSAYN